MHATIYCIKYNAEYLQIIIIDEKCFKHKICFVKNDIRGIHYELPVHFCVLHVP